MSGKRLLTVLSIAGLTLVMAMPSAVAATPSDNPAQATAKANASPHLRPAFHGAPPAGYPAARKAPALKPSVQRTPDTVTDPQGDTLSVTGASMGSLTTSSGFWTDDVNGIYFEDCTRPGLGYGGGQLPPCAYVQLHDSVTGGTTSTSNTQTDAIYDGCN